MITSLLNELIVAVIAALPRVFLFGTPVLAIGIVLAALADARMPGHAGGPADRAGNSRRFPVGFPMT